VYPVTAVGGPDPIFPTDNFKWSMVRAAPGGSRIKGLSYLREQITSPGNGTVSISACIASTGTNPSWTTCTPGTLYTRSLNGDGYNTVDMAMNDNGFHGVGWVASNSVSGLLRYLISFTKDNGATWDASAHEVGHYTGMTADDIDLASNETGSIGILVYYRLSGSPTPNPTDMYGAVTDSLVLYTYNMNVDPTFTSPVKTVIVAGSGAQFFSGCAGVCFALTGDGNDTFQAFYYQGGVPKVTAITNASTTPSTVTRTITNNSLVTTIQAASTCAAPSPYAGAAVVIPSGTGMGTYDIPVSGNIVLRTTNKLDEFMDNSVQTLALTRLYGGGAAIGLGRMSATGIISSTAKINDTLLYPPCPSPLTHNVGPKCAGYAVTGTGTLRHGGTVVGNVYYTSSILQTMDWNTGAGQYLASTQQIAIHQTSAEP